MTIEIWMAVSEHRSCHLEIIAHYILTLRCGDLLPKWSSAQAGRGQFHLLPISASNHDFVWIQLWTSYNFYLVSSFSSKSCHWTVTEKNDTPILPPEKKIFLSVAYHTVQNEWPMKWLRKPAMSDVGQFPAPSSSSLVVQILQVRIWKPRRIKNLSHRYHNLAALHSSTPLMHLCHERQPKTATLTLTKDQQHQPQGR